MATFIKLSTNALFNQEPIIPFATKVKEEIKFASKLLKRKLELHLDPPSVKQIKTVDDVLSNENAIAFAKALQEERNFPPYNSD